MNGGQVKAVSAMAARHWGAVIGSGVAVAVPVLLPMVPEPYKAGATMILGWVVALLNLFTEPPKAPVENASETKTSIIQKP